MMVTEGTKLPEYLRVAEDGDTVAFVITAGDENARIWWDGAHWTYNLANARPYLAIKEAKAEMSELRNSSGSTIRTECRDVRTTKPTIAELEAMMDAAAPTPSVAILPSGELAVNP